MTAKKIILLSDGTGNTTAKVWRTNVWRMFEAIDLNRSDQVAIYADGVGTSSFKPLAILGGAFGWGLKRNVLDLYKFACRHYKPGDEIFGFGFSRGAFTIRVVTALILNQGLVPYTSEEELEKGALAAYRAYRKERYSTIHGFENVLRGIRDLFSKEYDKSKNCEVAEIKFLGLWDTVAAYGMPIEEMMIGISQWIWPLEFRDRVLSEKVKFARHALSLDDDRTTFHPLLWTEEGENKSEVKAASTRDERISQVWFPGVHSNVGGGYPDDRLSYISLLWMMEEAKDKGLVFRGPPDSEPDAIQRAKSGQDFDGRIYDPRSGLGGTYRYGPRSIDVLCGAEDWSVPKKNLVRIDMPKIHESVFERIKGGNGYAPIGLPKRYAVVKSEGKIVYPSDQQNAEDVPDRVQKQHLIWDQVWKRRVVYFASVAVALALILLPFWTSFDRSDELSTRIRIVSESIRFISTALPSFSSIWVNAFAALPLSVLVIAGIVIGLILLGVGLQAKINDRMNGVWHGRSEIERPKSSLIYTLRSWTGYRHFIGTIKWKIAPVLSAAFIMYLVTGILSHVAFNVYDSFGMVCRPSSNEELPKIGRVSSEFLLKAQSPCQATGFSVLEGATYSVDLITKPDWRDGEVVAKPDGIDLPDVRNSWQRFLHVAFTPFRRIIMRTWFMPVARIGSTGTDEYFLDAESIMAKDNVADELKASNTFRARKSDELFLYVNDGSLFFWPAAFYGNNSGEAVVTVRRIR